VNDQELKRRVMLALLRELRARERDRRDREWQQRIDDALARRGYPTPRGRGRV
jgi:hypothetical protein